MNKKVLRTQVCMNKKFLGYRFAWIYKNLGINRLAYIQRSKDTSMHGYMDLGIQVCMDTEI